MKKQSKTAMITKSNLTNAFWMLYQKERIEKITVKDITAIAGYNRSTFYEYFTDVYDVLNYLEDSLLDYLDEHIVHGLDLLHTEEVLKRVTTMYEEKGEYLSFLLSEKGDPYFTKKFKNKLKPVMYASLPIKETDAYSAYLFEYVMSATLGTITYWYQEKRDIPLSELIVLIRSIHTEGVLHEIKKRIEKEQASHDD